MKIGRYTRPHHAGTSYENPCVGLTRVLHNVARCGVRLQHTGREAGADSGAGAAGDTGACADSAASGNDSAAAFATSDQSAPCYAAARCERAHGKYRARFASGADAAGDRRILSARDVGRPARMA